MVNLADRDASRFVKATIGLAVTDAEIDAALEHDRVTKPRLRAAILELLSRRTADEITTPEGKDALREEIADVAGDLLHATDVAEVLFTELIVQF